MVVLCALAKVSIRYPPTGARTIMPCYFPFPQLGLLCAIQCALNHCGLFLNLPSPCPNLEYFAYIIELRLIALNSAFFSFSFDKSSGFLRKGVVFRDPLFPTRSQHLALFSFDKVFIISHNPIVSLYFFVCSSHQASHRQVYVG